MEGERIDFGALVELEISGEVEWFFLAPAGGGTEVQHEGATITVITPESPLGSQLLGSRAGGQVKVPPGRILSVI